MSHTPGSVQKFILEQVSEQGYCVLNAVKAPELSVSRAAGRLAESGQVVVCEFLMGVPDKRSTSGRADRVKAADHRLRRPQRLAGAGLAQSLCRSGKKGADFTACGRHEWTLRLSEAQPKLLPVCGQLSLAASRHGQGNGERLR